MTKKQMLTDDEIVALQYKDGKDDHFVFARDIENAILAKLNDTKPVAYMTKDEFGVPDFVHACYVKLTGGQLPFPDNAEVIPLFTQTPVGVFQQLTAERNANALHFLDLAHQIKCLKTELKTIGATINDPALDLTKTAAECIAALIAERDAMKYALGQIEQTHNYECSARNMARNALVNIKPPA